MCLCKCAWPQGMMTCQMKLGQWGDARATLGQLEAMEPSVPRTTNFTNVMALAPFIVYK